MLIVQMKKQLEALGLSTDGKPLPGGVMPAFPDP